MQPLFKTSIHFVIWSTRSLHATDNDVYAMGIKADAETINWPASKRGKETEVDSFYVQCQIHEAVAFKLKTGVFPFYLSWISVSSCIVAFISRWPLLSCHRDVSVAITWLQVVVNGQWEEWGCNPCLFKDGVCLQLWMFSLTFIQPYTESWMMTLKCQCCDRFWCDVHWQLLTCDPYTTAWSPVMTEIPSLGPTIKLNRLHDNWIKFIW